MKSSNQVSHGRKTCFISFHDLGTAVVAVGLMLLSCTVCRADTDISESRVSQLTELSVEELMNVEVAKVYGASKFEQKVTEAPSSVSIVTADEIKRYGYRTLADILRSLRGTYLTYDRNYNYVGIRGFNRPGDLNTRVLLLVDGHRINDNIFEQAPIGTDFSIDIDLIDRVEFIRGPSSSLYGTNAFFGVVNVITRQADDLEGPEISGAVGSFETYNGRLSYGRQFGNGIGMIVSGSGLYSDGQDRLFFKEFNTPATNNGIAEHADDDRNYQFFTKLSFRDFTLTGARASRRKGIPTASYDTVFNTSQTRTTDEHSFVDLKYAHTFAETDVSARLFYDDYYYHGDYLYDRSSTGDLTALVLNKDLAWGSWWGSELQATRTFLGWNKVSTGAEYRDNFRQDQKNHDQEPFFSYLDDRRRSNIWALYLQDEIQIFPCLILSAGVRHDHYSTFGGTTNPRAALIYKPYDETVLKFIYGEAFRAPSTFEFFYNDGQQTMKTNPGLKPEKIRTYEAVLEQYLLGGHLRSSVSGFYYKIDDLISQQTDPADGLLQFENIDSVDAWGGELELEAKWTNGIQGRFSYTYQNNENSQTGKMLTNSPHHLAKLNLVVPLLRDKAFAGIEEQFTSSRTTLAGDKASSFYVTNLTLSFKNLLPGLELSSSVYNLFDTHYGDPSPGEPEHRQDIIGQDGRTFRLKLTYHF